jgi:putative spermidine/putrescine transport system permease protein
MLPLSLPGMIGGSLLVFTMAIAAYTTPVIMGGNRVLVMATFIGQQFRTVLDYALGATAAAVLMLLAGLLTLLAVRLGVQRTDVAR